MLSMLDQIGGKEVVEKYFNDFCDLVKNDGQIDSRVEQLISSYEFQTIIEVLCCFLLRQGSINATVLARLKIEFDLHEKDFNKVITCIEKVLIDGGEEKQLIAHVLAACLRLKKIIFTEY